MSVGEKNLVSSLISGASQALPYIIDGLTTDGMPAKGYVGNTLYADNVRILFFNGVGSREDHCREKAKEISKVFGNCRVDYGYVPLTFFSAVDAIADHTKPLGADLLLDTLRTFDQELRHGKRPSSSCKKAGRFLVGGERIICILHSGGGATLESIKNEIPYHVKDIMDVISFGSAQLFLTGEFRSVRNFVASNDPVPCVSAILSAAPERVFDAPIDVAPVLGRENPLESHQFLSRTYQNALQSARQEYDEELSH